MFSRRKLPIFFLGVTPERNKTPKGNDIKVKSFCTAPQNNLQNVKANAKQEKNICELPTWKGLGQGFKRALTSKSHKTNKQGREPVQSNNDNSVNGWRPRPQPPEAPPKQPV